MSYWVVTVNRETGQAETKPLFTAPDARDNAYTFATTITQDRDLNHAAFVVRKRSTPTSALLMYRVWVEYGNTRRPLSRLFPSADMATEWAASGLGQAWSVEPEDVD
jgi:hypothetical protein